MRFLSVAPPGNCRGSNSFPCRCNRILPTECSGFHSYPRILVPTRPIATPRLHPDSAPECAQSMYIDGHKFYADWSGCRASSSMRPWSQTSLVDERKALCLDLASAALSLASGASTAAVVCPIFPSQSSASLRGRAPALPSIFLPRAKFYISAAYTATWCRSRIGKDSETGGSLFTF
jgi:hypothetical protein